MTISNKWHPLYQYKEFKISTKMLMNSDIPKKQIISFAFCPLYTRDKSNFIEIFEVFSFVLTF